MKTTMFPTNEAVPGTRPMLLLVFWVCLGLLPPVVQAATYTARLSGDWVNPAIWGGTGAPGPGDTANIITNSQVTMINGEAITNLNLLYVGGTGLTNPGTLMVANSSQLTVTNLINIGGSTFNDGAGTLIVSNGATLNIPPRGYTANVGSFAMRALGSKLLVDNSTMISARPASFSGSTAGSCGQIVITNGAYVTNAGIIRFTTCYSNVLYIGGRNASGAPATLYTGGRVQIKGTNNLMIVDRGGVYTNAFIDNSVAHGAGVIITNGGKIVHYQLAAIGDQPYDSEFYGIVTGTDTDGTPSTWDLRRAPLYVGAWMTSSPMNNNYVSARDGGILINVGAMSIGYNAYGVNPSNTVSVGSGSLVDINSTNNGILVGCYGGAGNAFFNNGGVLQFTAGIPTNAILNANTDLALGNGIFMNSGTLSYRDISGVDLTDNWVPVVDPTACTNVSLFTWQGANTYRLDNASANNPLTGSYILSSILGPTNYARLELINGTTALAGQGLNVDSTGSLLVSNTTATINGPITNAGAITLVNASLSVNSPVKLQAGGTLRMKINRGGSPASDSVAVGGALAYGGTLVVTNAGGAVQVGDSFTLFTATSHSGSFATLTLPPKPSNSDWVFSNGVLSVVATGPSGPAQLTNSVSAGYLNLSWPADQGWRLQSQTNTVAVGLSTNWADITPATNWLTVPLVPENGAVFYRLIYP